MHLFFERWTEDETIRPIALGELEMVLLRHLPSDKFDDLLIRHLPSVENRPLAMDDFGKGSARHLSSYKNRPLATDELPNEGTARHPQAIPDTRSYHRRRPSCIG